jgi:uncharacterized membrane protein YvbJ
MDVNWTVLGIVAFCAIILIVYLIRKNLKDKEEVTKSFTEQINTEKKFELDDDE